MQRPDLPVNVTLMHMVLDASSEAELEQVLECQPDMLKLWRETPHAWQAMRDILAAEADQEGTLLEHFARLFDRAVAISPEASVALYSLGRPDLLDQATSEVMDILEDWNLISPGLRVLEIGCGIGRFCAPLVTYGCSVIGLDISAGMLAEARRRNPGALLARTSGRELSCIADTSVDLILAIDVFPYLSAAGLVPIHVSEARRVLRPGGSLVVMNWSYRGDAELDRSEAARLASAQDLALIAHGEAGLSHWDGQVYWLRKDK